MDLHSIQDGDTFTIHWRPAFDIRTRIRLAAIDAPERGEPFFRESMMELQRLLNRGRVTLMPTMNHRGPVDHCNRMICWVTVDGLLVQSVLVARGLAVVWEPNGVSELSAALHAGEHYAKTHRLGVWKYPAHRLCDVYRRPRQH